MMASERPASSPLAEETPPLDATPPADPIPRPTEGTLKPSPFLKGFDVALAVGVLVLAFGLASFAVRNSDFWLHLGTGRSIAQGQYEFGKAPFTYSGTDRYWTNHSWLYDLTTFAIYERGGGEAIVAFKALLLAGLATILLFVRKPSQNLWLSVLMVGLALVASAPRLLMQPSICSYCFMGLTVAILLGIPARAKSWALPIALGTTFWLWANLDQWFFLGPITVTLYLLGEFLQRKWGRRVEGEERPSLATLAIALGVGIASCMLNPHHIHIWELPAELLPNQLAATLAKEPSLNHMFRMSFAKGTFDLDFGFKGSGNVLNTVAFFALLVLNVLGAVLNFRRLSWGLALVNVGLFALAIVHYRALPFYALAAAPLTALNLGMAADRLRARTFSLARLQLFAIGRVAVRMVLFVVGSAALVACWPGWLHPLSHQRRVAWEVEPDAALERTARTLQRWRDEGKVPAEARSLIINIDLADYCAWFAPSEKTYFDIRVGFHAPEAETYTKLRQQYQKSPFDPPPPRFDTAPFLTEQKITHLVIGSNSRFESAYNFDLLLRTGTQGKAHWELWDIEGKFGIFGWRRQAVVAEGKFEKLRFDPLQTAFGPDVALVPDPGPLSLPIKRGTLEKFLAPAPAAPDAADESLLLQSYDESLKLNFQNSRDEYNGEIMVYLTRLLATGSMTSGQGVPIPPVVPPELNATALLAVRAARRAIVQSPSSPSGYLSLVQAYRNPGFVGPFQDSRNFLIAATLERYFARVLPEQAAGNAEMYEAGILLANLHFRSELRKKPREELLASIQRGEEIRADLCLDALKKAFSILRASPELQKIDKYRNDLKSLETQIVKLEADVRNLENTWLVNESSDPSPISRAMKAQRLYWLSSKSLEALKKLDLSDGSKIPLDQRFATMLTIAHLQLATGHAELADALLEEIVEKLNKLSDEVSSKPELAQFVQNYGLLVRDLRIQSAMIVGRFSQAIQETKQKLAESEARLDRIRRSDLQTAVPLTIARRLAQTSGPSLSNVLVDVYTPYLNNLINDRFTAGFRGNAFQLQLFEEIVVQKYYGMVFEEENLRFQLGTIYLEQGDNRNAAMQFRQIPAAPLSTETRSNAAGYLRLIAPRP